MADKFAENKAHEMAEDLWTGVSVMIASGKEAKESFMSCVPIYLQGLIEQTGKKIVENERLSAEVKEQKEKISDLEQNAEISAAVIDGYRKRIDQLDRESRSLVRDEGLRDSGRES